MNSQQVRLDEMRRGVCLVDDHADGILPLYHEAHAWNTNSKRAHADCSNKSRKSRELDGESRRKRLYA